MLSLLKRKPFLTDLIPDNHIDIHSHLLPGIDDGAKKLDDTAFLVNEMCKIGFGQLITTPHVMNNVWENTASGIQQKFSDTHSSLVGQGIKTPMKAAAEYLIDSNFVKLFQSEKLLTLKGNYVLIEMSYINPPIQLYEIIFELQLAGYIPVLAHPERYSFYHNNFKEYQKLKDSGCLFQINLLSTVGYYGMNVAKIAERLLQRDLVDVAGSDVHHKNHISAFYKRILIKDMKPLQKAIEKTEMFRF